MTMTSMISRMGFNMHSPQPQHRRLHQFSNNNHYHLYVHDFFVKYEADNLNPCFLPFNANILAVDTRLRWAEPG